MGAIKIAASNVKMEPVAKLRKSMNERLMKIIEFQGTILTCNKTIIQAFGISCSSHMYFYVIYIFK